MESTTAPLLNTLNLNTRLFANCMADVDDTTAKTRPSANTNNMVFLVCHLVDARHHLARMLGIDVECPCLESLANIGSIEEVREFPALADLALAWEDVSDLLRERLEAASQEELALPSPHQFPVSDPTLGGAVLFLLQHESFHLGQLALLRKYLGFPPMSYAALEGA